MLIASIMRGHQVLVSAAREALEAFTLSGNASSFLAAFISSCLKRESTNPDLKP
jgi:hypothetical protein